MILKLFGIAVNLNATKT